MGPRTARLRIPTLPRRATAALAVCAAGFALVGATHLGTLAAADTVAVAVDATKPGAKIDHNIFGQFAEHLGTASTTASGSGPIRPSPTRAASAMTSSRRSRR